MSLPIKFPYKLYAMLEYAADSEHASAVSWIDEGQAFAIHDKDAFLKHVVPIFFKQTKYHSFTRKLNFWGFHRTSWRGTVMMGWGHEHFVRGKVGDLQLIKRVKIKSRKKAEHAKKNTSPIAEPDVSPAASAFVTERRSTLSPSFASPAASFARPSHKPPPPKVGTRAPREKCDLPAAINIHDSGKDFNGASSAGTSARGAKRNASPSEDSSATRHGASPSDAKNDKEPPPEEEPAQMALPPGWKAAEDGDSGRVYYYRRQDLPSEGGSPPILGTGGCPAPPAVSVDIIVPGPLREGAEAMRDEGAKTPVPDAVASSVPDVVTSCGAQRYLDPRNDGRGV